jgi:hypothetical protein
MTNFFIWFLGRTGSTHLVTLLDSHPQISCWEEIFFLEYGGKKLKRRDKFPDAQSVRRRLRKLYGHKTKTVGFKFKFPPHYETYPDAWAYLYNRRKTVRLICLRRHNVLKRAISKLNHDRLRHETGGSNIRASKPRTAPPVTVNINQLLQSLPVYEQEDQQLVCLAQGFEHRLTIYYEDLLHDEDNTTKTVMEFMGVNAKVPLATRTAKYTADDLRESVANYGELREALLGTSHEQYLE